MFDKTGLVGSPWHPDIHEENVMQTVQGLQKNQLKTEKAGLMLEALLWEPSAYRGCALSAASMPMSLKSADSDKGSRNHGKWVLHALLRAHFACCCFF